MSHPFEAFITHENNPEQNYEKSIERKFKILLENANEGSGLFPAVDSRIETPESKENDMSKAWIRDTAWNLLTTAETIKNVHEINPHSETIPRMQEFLAKDLQKVLTLLNQDRWLEKFKQEVVETEACTYLSGEAPDVHMEIDGGACGWLQNQPESWGDLLIAIGNAKAYGAVKEYSTEEMNVVRSMTEYLVHIKPWKFNGAAMWEGLSVHSPASRSNAVAIAKGLEAVLPLFTTDTDFYQKINETIDHTMDFVKEDINDDYTAPSEHPNGADLAMLVSMTLPETERTKLPFLTYIQENSATLGIGSLPGAIRYSGDQYKRGEYGEARWFMADPILAINYFKEAKEQFTLGDIEKAKEYETTGNTFLTRALNISKQYGYDSELFPELFIQRDPNNVKGQKHILELNDGSKDVALQPLERSLIWNSGLLMMAETLSANVSKISNKTPHSYPAQAA